MKRRLIICAMLCLLTAASFTACSDDDISSGESKPEDTGSTAESKPEETGSAAVSEADTSSLAETSEDSSADTADEAKYVKAFLNGLNTQALKNGLDKFSLSYSSKYGMLPTENADKNSPALSYEESGSAELCYIGSPTDEAEELSTADIIKSGEGYLKGTIVNKLNTSSGSKKSEDDPNSKRNVENNIAFTIKLDKNDLYAVGDVSYNYPNSPGSNEKNSFCGKIEKKVLTESLSETVLENARAQLFTATKAWDFISGVSEIAGYGTETLDLTDSRNVSEFIKKHQLTFKEDGNSVDISFVLDTGAILSAASNETHEFAKVKGKMKIEKDSGKVLSYSYDLTEYVSAVLNTTKEDDDVYDYVTDSFTVEYEADETSPDELKIEGEIKEYTAENLYEFAEKFEQCIINMKVQPED